MASIRSRMPVNDLASALTSSVDGFRPDGPFLIRVAVLVSIFSKFPPHLTYVVFQRTICLRDSGNNFWPLVAKELEEIRNCENPNQ